MYWKVLWDQQNTGIAAIWWQQMELKAVEQRTFARAVAVRMHDVKSKICTNLQPTNIG